MPYGGNDWLALTQEPTPEPEIPICDPHVNAGEKMYRRAGVKLHHGWTPNAPGKAFAARQTE